MSTWRTARPLLEVVIRREAVNGRLRIATWQSSGSFPSAVRAGAPGQGREAEGERGQQRYPNHGERDVPAGKIGAQRAAVGQRRGLDDEGRPGPPDRVGVEDPDECDAEDRAEEHHGEMALRADEGADGRGDHDDPGDAPVDQRYGFAPLVDPEPGGYGAAQAVPGQGQCRGAHL